MDKCQICCDKSKLLRPNGHPPTQRETTVRNFALIKCDTSCNKRSRIAVEEKQKDKFSNNNIEEEQKDRFSNDDIAIEILSRLPIEETRDLQRVSKRWCELLSHPSFISAHFQRSTRKISGLYIQGMLRCDKCCCANFLDIEGIDYISIGKEKTNVVHNKCLNFLPEKVVVTGSSNGILLCRSFFEELYADHSFDRMRSKTKEFQKEVTLYVCNPFTKDWSVIKLIGKYRNGCSYGFSYDPFLSSFHIVMVQRPWSEKDPYLFKIYSSNTGEWRISKEACPLSGKDQINLHQGCFSSGVFYWLTTAHSVLAFDLKQEKSQIIKLPGLAMDWEGRDGICIGVSEGKLQYVCFGVYELRVWGFEDNVWVLKHSKLQREMHHPDLGGNWEQQKQVPRDPDYEHANHIMHPYSLQDEVLFLQIARCMCSYNIRIGEFQQGYCVFSLLSNSTYDIPVVIPHFKSLLRVRPRIMEIEALHQKERLSE